MRIKSSMFSYVRLYASLVEALIGGSKAAVETALLEKGADVPKDLVRRMFTYYCTGDVTDSPIKYASVVAGKVRYEAATSILTDDSTVKEVSTTTRTSDDRIALFDNYVQGVDPANPRDMEVLAWMIALFSQTGLSLNWFQRQLVVTEEIMATREGESEPSAMIVQTQHPFFTTPRDDSGQTWWAYSQTLPLYIGK